MKDAADSRVWSRVGTAVSTSPTRHVNILPPRQHVVPILPSQQAHPAKAVDLGLNEDIWKP